MLESRQLEDLRRVEWPVEIHFAARTYLQLAQWVHHESGDMLPGYVASPVLGQLRAHVFLFTTPRFCWQEHCQDYGYVMELVLFE